MKRRIGFSGKCCMMVFLFCMTPLFAQSQKVDISALVEAAIDSIEPAIPNVDRLFPYHIRDASVCKGSGGKYYLTGTTDDTWGISEGIRVWESADMKAWKLIGRDGYVWRVDSEAVSPSQLEIKERRGRLMRAIWAPEIHFKKDNYWITYSISEGYGSGLLKSLSGKPEGPYRDVSPEGSLVKGIDATLFTDTDGSVWYIWGDGRMKKLKDDMTGFENDEPPLYPLDAEGNKVGYEGVNVYYREGRYYLMAAEWNSEGPGNGHILRSTNENRRAADGRYDCMIAVAEKLTGPYSKPYIALAHGGHNMIFDDFEGNTWATIFGNDEAAAPFREQPGIVKMKFSVDGRISPVIPLPSRPENDMPVIFVSSEGNGKGGTSWKKAFRSLQSAVDIAGPGTQIWVAEGTYNGPVTLASKQGIYILGGFKGNESSSAERSGKNGGTIISGSGIANHVLLIEDSEYVRIDGLTIEGGRAEGAWEDGCGGGIILKGGGETVTFSGCIIRDNFAIKDGGGVWAVNGASPLFVCCEFINNEAHENGGAVYVDCNADNGYHTRFYNCLISRNKAQANGGVAYIRTDLKQTGTLRFVNCQIDNNFTLLEGGNIFLTGGATLLMANCTVVNNRGLSSGTTIATLGNIPAQNRIINSIFYGNEGGTTLFTANAYTGVDRITGFEQNWTIVRNCIFNSNKTLALFGYPHNMERFFTVKEINALSWGEGNFDTNPMLSDPGNNDFSLKPGSPAIDMGTNDNFFPFDFTGRKRTLNPDYTKSYVNIGCHE
ncbi:MAG: family 43 glycosylhydrolase [Bacteroidales bacterium]|nr:family 43 glycosylhydrolase [Bacteroidales bacterium]